MKKTILAMVAGVISLTLLAAPPLRGNKSKSNTLRINTEESTLKWHAKKVTGEHFGFIRFHSGEVTVSKNRLIGGFFAVDMKSLETTDLSGEYKNKLEGHLKSDDFFSAENFPNATLRIKSATPIPGAKPGSDNYTIVADLSIKGITKEISFPAMVVVGKGKVIANADINIDRTKFDIRYGSKSFISDIGDKAIDDQFNIKVRIIAQEQAS